MKLFSIILAIAFLPFAGHSQTVQSGVYIPAVLAHSPGINPVPQLTHYTRIGDEVQISGSVFLNGFPAVGKKTFFTLSSFYTIANINSAKGVGVFTQAIPKQGVVYIQGEPSTGQVTFYFYPDVANVGYANFTFWYSASPQ